MASGLLTGKFSKNTNFEKGDHRQFNRDGAFFDKGETFSGIPYEKGIEAVEALKAYLPKDISLTEAALKWILMKPEVSCIIPGASRAEQITSNIAASSIPDLHKKLQKAEHKSFKNHKKLQKAEHKPLRIIKSCKKLSINL